MTIHLVHIQKSSCGECTSERGTNDNMRHTQNRGEGGNAVVRRSDMLHICSAHHYCCSLAECNNSSSIAYQAEGSSSSSTNRIAGYDYDYTNRSSKWKTCSHFQRNNYAIDSQCNSADGQEESEAGQQRRNASFRGVPGHLSFALVLLCRWKRQFSIIYDGVFLIRLRRG